MDLQTGHASKLLALPLEMLIHISSYLTTADYGNLRLVCKHLQASYFKPFAQEFFTKRQFMLTEFSLGTLVEISKSCYAPFLTHLIISVHSILPEFDPTIRTNDDTADAARSNKFMDECIKHQLLISTGQDCELLAEALQNLPGLKIIGMRNFNSTGRYRDGKEALWNSYGTTTLLTQTGLRLPQPLHRTRDQNIIAHVFVTILRALGKCSQTRPERFEVILRGLALPEKAFYIPHYLEPSVIPVLSNLKALFLDLNSAFGVFKSASKQQIQGMVLESFLHRVPALEHLRLNFQDVTRSYVGEFLQRLSRPCDGSGPSSGLDSVYGKPILEASGLPRQIPPVNFPNLTQLDIGFLTIDPHVLMGLFKKFKPTLRGISLHRVELQPEVAQRQGNPDLWAKLFDMLAASGLTLTSISFTSLSQSTVDDNKVRTTFNTTGHKSQDMWHWSGSHVDLPNVLKDLKKCLPIPPSTRWDPSDTGDYTEDSEEGL